MSSKALSKEAAISAAISAAKEVVKAEQKAAKKEATAARIAATKVKNGMIIAAKNLTGRELKQSGITTSVKVVKANIEEAVETAKTAKVKVKVKVAKEEVNAAKTAQKITKVRNVLSMENLAVQLLTNKASEKEIEAAFVAAYAAKGNTDLKFIKTRIAIYLHIAQK
jgi:hypothetical protein